MATKRTIKVKINKLGEMAVDNTGNPDEARILKELAELAELANGSKTGFKVEKKKDKDCKDVETAVFFDRPNETAKVENGEVVFPMTPFNYRMIALTQPQ